jgi:hypothetical protein
MKMMRLTQAVKRLQAKLDIFESSLPPRDRGPLPNPPADTTLGMPDDFLTEFLTDIDSNMKEPFPNRRHYSPSSWAVAFVLRTLCPQSYEFQRHLFPLPQIKHIDAYYADELKMISSALSNEDDLPGLLEYDKSCHVPADYSGKILPVEQDHDEWVFEQSPDGFIPAVLAVDAMAIEPYKEQTKRLLLLSQARREANGGRLEMPEVTVDTAAYVFVFYLMPLDPALPNQVIAVRPHVDGKASATSNAYSADGDSSYLDFLHPLAQFALSPDGRQLPFVRLVDLVRSITDYAFITDFLHFLKCLRNRMARYSISLHPDLPPFSAREIGALLAIENCVQPKSPSAQLKDAIALQVFTFENLVVLLATSHLQAALYFMPICLWRLAIQALNVTREMRFRLLNIAFDVARRAADLHEGTDGVAETGPVGSTVGFYREHDIEKLTGSLMTLGSIFKLPIDRIALNRAASIGLEHLFGTTRDESKGDNHQEKLLHRMVVGNLTMQLVERHGMIIHRKRHRNIGGTTDDRTKRDGLLDWYDWMGGCDIADLLIGLLVESPVPGGPMTQPLFWLVSQFAWLGEQVHDGQRHRSVTVLGGHSIMPRIQAIETLGGGKFYWTRHRLERLKDMTDDGATPAQIAEALGIEEPTDLARGLKKFDKLISRPS